MRCSFYRAALAALSLLSSGAADVGYAQAPPTLGRIERADAGLEALLPADAEIEILARGFTWSEGPLWIDGKAAGEGHLLFTDIPRNSIFRWHPDTGITLFMEPSGYTGVSFYGTEPGANGLALDRQGHLIMCEHGDRRVSVLTNGGGKRTLVDNYQGGRLNSPNDLIAHSSGAIYFTDPPYGLPGGADDPRRELDFCGVYRLGTDGKLDLLTKELARPNGIAFSPDEKTLYVAQSDPAKAIWMAFPVRTDGMLEQGRVLFSAQDDVGKMPGLPDGLDVDRQGNLWASGPGGIYVISPAGKLLGRIITEQATSNCCLGGPNGDELFITADSYLCRVKTKTHALP
jgi:gluconolactonase